MIEFDGVETVEKADKLKPCPFCGGKANFYVKLASVEGFDRGWHFGIFCTKCGTTTPRTDYKLAVEFADSGELLAAVDERSLAAEAWNRRADNGKSNG